MIVTGPALVLGDDVNTDALHPSRFYSLADQKVRSGFLGAVRGREEDGRADVSGFVVVAGRNFGVGSSRETGARVFLLAGIRAVVAVSFARIFHRNLLNLGLAAIECPGLAERKPLDREVVTLDLDGRRLAFGEVSHETQALDPHWVRVLEAGGLVPWMGLGQAP